jgi:hypothetical protein
MRPVAEVLGCSKVEGCSNPKHHGDRVMIGKHRGPVYEIVFIHGELAWVKPVANGQQGLARVASLTLV